MHHFVRYARIIVRHSISLKVYLDPKDRKLNLQMNVSDRA